MISKSTKRLINDLQYKIEVYQPNYAGDHLIDRVYVMDHEPIYCLSVIRENGTEFYDLTCDHGVTREEWNKQIDSILSGCSYWLQSANIKAINAYCYGYCHTIAECLSGDKIDEDNLKRAIKEVTLLIESFRR